MVKNVRVKGRSDEMKFTIYRMIHLIITGIITIPITLFIASGGLGENYTDSVFILPQFLIIILVWLIGAVLSFHSTYAKYGLVVSALPPLFFIGSVVFAWWR